MAKTKMSVMRAKRIKISTNCGKYYFGEIRQVEKLYKLHMKVCEICEDCKIKDMGVSKDFFLINKCFKEINQELHLKNNTPKIR